MKTVLFQGDSITDMYRTSTQDEILGIGYPVLVAAQLGYEYPEKYKFINRGINGSRVVDVYARIKSDIINLKPDILSILIGVNDVWHELGGERNGVDAEKYYKVYSMLIQEIKDALPNTEIMIMEPFVLKASAMEKEWEIFKSEVLKRAEKAKAVAEEYGLTYIPLQEKFDEAESRAKAAHWLYDGVHPSSAGHEIIRKEWVNAFKKSVLKGK